MPKDNNNRNGTEKNASSEKLHKKTKMSVQKDKNKHKAFTAEAENTREVHSEIILESRPPEVGVPDPVAPPLSLEATAPTTYHKETKPMSTAELTTETPVETKPMPEAHVIEAIIRKRVYGSMAIGLVPIPAFDLTALTAVQVELLYRLAQAYDVPFKKEWAKQAVGIVLSVGLTGLLTPTMGDLCRYIPVIGTALSIATWPVNLGAATYALGTAFAKHFASGGNLLNCDLSKISEQVKNSYGKSVDTVKSWTKKSKDEAEKDELAETAEIVS